MLVVPGSQQIKREAERRGYAQVFLDAGAEWRESGCSMCLGMNGDLVPAGQYCVSTATVISKPPGHRRPHSAREPGDRRGDRWCAGGRITDPREFLHPTSA